MSPNSSTFRPFSRAYFFSAMSNDQPKPPSSGSDWHPADVLAALKKRGKTLAGISVAHGYHPTAAGKALSARGRRWSEPSRPNWERRPRRFGRADTRSKGNQSRPVQSPYRPKERIRQVNSGSLSARSAHFGSYVAALHTFQRG